MNNIKTSKRNSLGQENLVNRMRIMSQNLKVKEYDTKCAVTKWLCSGKRKQRIVSSSQPIKKHITVDAIIDAVAREPDAVAREPSNSLPDMDGPDYTDSEGSHSEFEGFGPDDIY